MTASWTTAEMPSMSQAHQSLLKMSDTLDGELRLDAMHRMLYAQDASVYQEEPLGVFFPRHKADLLSIVQLAQMFKLPIIPRAAGTSLAGQCVGNGLVVDVGRHMNQILEVNVEEKWVRVQPGVILDDLNRHLAQWNLFFGPDTSTASRCMIGGMIGNNSCGSHSILYGTTRDHVLELDAIFADGTNELIRPWTGEELDAHLLRQDALGHGLRAIHQMLTQHDALIRDAYPRLDVKRRNTGYALDELLIQAPYAQGFDETARFDFTRFLCGSEGTIALTAEAKLNLVDAPKVKAVVCAHFDSLDASLRATVHAVDHNPAAVELMDKRILDLAKNNIEQRRNRFFIEGDPEAILAVEFYGQTKQEVEDAMDALIADFQQNQLGYAYPIVRTPKDKAVWSVRKAGLGILMGVPGDVKPVTVVEDTAVAVDVLPDYIRDFSELMASYDTQCVYYAHASVGELHLRPELNIKDPGDVEKFLGIAHDVTDLVKKYGGSISGEHGDGRLRAPMLEQFYGKQVADFHVALKDAFDPHHLLNPNKIVNALPMDADWRFEPGEPTPVVETHYDWSADMGLIRAIEKCNGAGACRKRAEAGGTMCPSYMATLEEKDSTRGRANVFRQLVRENQDPREAMASPVLYDAMSLCLSCKGCKSECPASVDMGRMKSEFLQHYHDAHGTPMSAHLFGRYNTLSKMAMWMPRFANWVMALAVTRWLLLKVAGISKSRQLPGYASQAFTKSFKQQKKQWGDEANKPPVLLYVDPFTEYTEPHIAQATVEVLRAGGYRVELLDVQDDGRTMISKGLLRQARTLARKNVQSMKRALATYPDAKIVGMEPSALLTFRDEAPDLVGDDLRDEALRIAESCLLVDEFVLYAAEQGNYDNAWRTDLPELVLHGHCYQKALVGLTPTVKALELAGYEVEALSTGCCGMAGSFGYEDKHYELSMRIGELVLFPAVRETEAGVVAPGTSCRHQIMDGTGREASHPAIWLKDALM